MKSEFAANQALQTKYKGKTPIVYNQGKHATIGAMLQSYLTRFAALITVVILAKHFI